MGGQKWNFGFCCSRGCIDLGIPLLGIKSSPVPSLLISQWPKHRVSAWRHFWFLIVSIVIECSSLISCGIGILGNWEGTCGFTQCLWSSGQCLVLVFTGGWVYMDNAAEIFPIWNYLSNIIWVFNFKAVRNRCSMFFQIPLILWFNQVELFVF